MNARILRKWSIHTKNLMSCSVCSLVVVVLLLLVTCAPSLILATMNSRSDASFAANPPHMPKNVIKETTSSSSSSSSLSPSSLSSLLTLPNRNHRLASPRVEVMKNIGSDREPFPGYYKNHNLDDTQQMPQIPPGYISPTSSSSNSGLLISTRGGNSGRQLFNENIQQYSSSDNLGGYNLNLRGWPRQHTTTSQQAHSSSYNDDDTKSSFIDNDDEDIVDNNDDDDDNINKRVLGVIKNINNHNNNRQQANLMSSYTKTNRNFPVQQPQHYNLRRLDDRTHHVAPSSPSLQTPTQMHRQQHIQQLASSSTALSKQPELIHSNKNNINLKNIFSTTHNKSVPGDNAFDVIDISNVNKIKSSGLPLRFIIESYEVPPSLPLARSLTEQQRRMLIHQQQQAARSRRDSLRGRYKKYEHDLPSASSSSSLSSSSSSVHIQQRFRKSSSHHSLRQHQQQRMRKHSRRYCSARDPAQLAFEAPTVFEGKIVSMTPDRRMNFSATVEVREVFKQQIGSRLQKYLRLQFAYRNNSGECDIYREQLRPRGLVRGDTIEPGRIYLLFVQQIDIGNFTILGQPIRKTKRVVEAVRNAVSENYAQHASIKSISASNRTVENGQELRIVCKVTGRPPPKVTWFKDHRSINRNRKLYQFSHYKKRSELIIRSFNTSDAGRYECRAKNKVNRTIERRAIVIKAYPVPRFDPNPRGTGNSCPADGLEFCFNGGTCKFFSEIGSYSCICPEGFIGERCDRKEVNNMPPSTYSNEQECGEKKFLGSYYC